MELLVEDNEDDVALFKRAFAMRGIFNPNVQAISTRVAPTCGMDARSPKYRSRRSAGLVQASGNRQERLVEAGCILQIEDDEDDVLFFALAAESVGLRTPICVARDGQEAIDLLKPAIAKIGRKSKLSCLPKVVLLDLKLPRIMGLDVLRWNRKQPVLKKLPVIVLSSSTHSSDIQAAIESGAGSYLGKPFTLSDRITFARQLKAWLAGKQGLPGSPGRATPPKV